MKYIIAITGPSGSGKTTLSDLLHERDGYIVPKHCTTREPRKDDTKGFYRYLKHTKCARLKEKNKFLIISGDSEIIKKENGKFYGVLLKDCKKAFAKGDIILLLISYKDVKNLLAHESKDLKILVLNLTFEDIKNTIIQRICTSDRSHSNSDVENRISSAIELREQYKDIFEMENVFTIYTDVNGIEKTYKIANQKIKEFTNN